MTTLCLLLLLLSIVLHIVHSDWIDPFTPTLSSNVESLLRSKLHQSTSSHSHKTLTFETKNALRAPGLEAESIVAIRLFLLASTSNAGVQMLSYDDQGFITQCSTQTTKRMEEMSTEEVATLLRKWKLNDAFEESFRETQIDGEMLIDMTMEDLEEMNVGLKLQRRRLLRLVKNTHESYSDSCVSSIGNEDVNLEQIRNLASKLWIYRDTFEQFCKNPTNYEWLSNELQWYHSEDLCATVQIHDRVAHRVYENLRDSILSPYSDIFSPQELFSFKRFKNAFHLVRAFAIQRNGKESWDRAVSTDSEMLSQALTQTSNHTSTYLLATRGGANEAFETLDVLRFRRELNGIRRRKKKKKKRRRGAKDEENKPECVRLEFRHDPISPSIDTASLPLDLVKLGEHEISASILGLQDRALQFEVDSNGVLPRSVLAALRYHSVDESDNISAKRLASSRPLSVRNERVVNEQIERVSKIYLDMFTTTLEFDTLKFRRLDQECRQDDSVSVRENDPCLLRNLVHARMQTKRILYKMLESTMRGRSEL